MAVSQADIDQLNQAIARGIRSVTLGEQTVTYNTTTSLIQARNDMVVQLAAQNAAIDALLTGRTRGRQTYIYFAGRE